VNVLHRDHRVRALHPGTRWRDARPLRGARVQIVHASQLERGPVRAQARRDGGRLSGRAPPRYAAQITGHDHRRGLGGDGAVPEVPAPARASATNPPLLAALSGLQFVLFPIPVITLFWKDQIGMSLTDIMVLQALFGAAVVLLEFPSGYLADRVGHRRSLLVGAAGWTLGWIIYARGETFAAIALAEMILGAGAAFISGADRALLWVSLETAGRAGEYTRWEGRMRAAAQTAEALSSGVGGWLYATAPRLPFWLQVPVAALGAGAAMALREAPRRAAPRQRSHVRHALHVARFVLWHHPRLKATMALGVSLGLSSFVLVWLIQPWMQARGVPVALFGPLWAAAHLWLAGVSLASARVARVLGVRATLLGCCVLIAVGYAGLALSASPWGAAFYLCVMAVRGLQGPILARIMQEDAPPEERASTLSLAALAFRLAFVFVGPAVGRLVDRAGMEAAMTTLAVGCTLASLAAFAAFVRAHARTGG
jgi:MFS family permease